MKMGGVTEVAEALGVSRQRLAKLRERNDFPAPIAELAQGPIWDVEEVRAWNGSGLRPSSAGRPRSEVVARTLGERFVLEEQIGSGGFADVWRAFDRKHSGKSPSIVAVKVLRNVHLANPGIVERFRRELQLLERFDHPHVMKILASGAIDDESIWYAMPLAQQSLADEIDRFDKPVLIKDLMGQVCSGLRYIHEQGILHRDLKPDNILRTADGSWAISDFGLAVEVERTTRLTPVTRFGMGTEHYSAPEQLDNAFHATARSDIYALGKVLQHVVTGKLPVSPAMPNNVFRAIVETATAARPEERHATAEQFFQAVQRAVDAEATTSWESAADTAARMLERVRLPKPHAQDLDEFLRWAASLDEHDEEDMEALTRVLPWISRSSIRTLWGSRNAAFSNVFARFARHISVVTFSFDFCDVLADFCRDMVNETGDLSVLRSATTALCDLGYAHTRWHVRSTLAAILQAVRKAESAVAAVEGLKAASDAAVRWTVTDFTLRSLHPHLRRHIEAYFDEAGN